MIEQLIQEDIWDETDIHGVRHGVEGKVILARAKMQRLKSTDEGGIRSPPRVKIQRAKSEQVRAKKWKLGYFFYVHFRG